MNICEKINTELLEYVSTTSGLGVVVNNFGSRVKQLLHNNRLEVTNYDIDKLIKSLSYGKRPNTVNNDALSGTVLGLIESHKRNIEIKVKGSDLFKGNPDIPSSFKNRYADSFNSYASIISKADDSLFNGSMSRVDYIKHFLLINVVKV